MPALAPARSGMPLPRLLAFLDQDPDNVALLADAAWAAFEADDADLAADLLARRAGLTDPSPDLVNLSGLAALRRGRFGEAATVFAALLTENEADPALRFNLAWCRAMEGGWDAVDGLIDERTATEVPRAAALKIEALHHLGRLEEALALGEQLAERLPGDKTLMGALAAAALDDERSDLAMAYAERGGDAPQAKASLGMVLLDRARPAEALEAFDIALANQPGNARALIGKGLALMADGQSDEAAHLVDAGAAAFGDHLGSWVAAGWAWLARGDRIAARERFERVVALDDTFAEGHGGLAVLDAMDGNAESARRLAEVAARLDRDSFSAALAQVLLLQAAGNEEAAARLVERAMATSIDGSGRTLAQAIAALGAGRR